jgi:hypothetical protein
MSCMITVLMLTSTWEGPAGVDIYTGKAIVGQVMEVPTNWIVIQKGTHKRKWPPWTLETKKSQHRFDLFFFMTRVQLSRRSWILGPNQGVTRASYPPFNNSSSILYTEYNILLIDRLEFCDKDYKTRGLAKQIFFCTRKTKFLWGKGKLLYNLGYALWPDTYSIAFFRVSL